jgi:hypothetical protein
MKITRRQLRQLIKEELMSETASLGLMFLGQRGQCSNRAIQQLERYHNMKSDAGGIGGLDKYFHVLAFYTAAKVVRNCMTDTETRALLTGAGFALELKQRLKGDWKADMVANEIGVDAALRNASTVEVTSLALDYAMAHGLPTWREFLARNENVPEGVYNADKYRELYGWALEEHPAVFADDKPFVQPRYHGHLRPRQRRAAYMRQGMTPQTRIKGPLRLNKPE